MEEKEEKKDLGTVLAETYSDHGKDMGAVIQTYMIVSEYRLGIWTVAFGTVLIMIAVGFWFVFPEIQDPALSPYGLIALVVAVFGTALFLSGLWSIWELYRETR